MYQFWVFEILLRCLISPDPITCLDCESMVRGSWRRAQLMRYSSATPQNMMDLIFNKARGPWFILRAYISRCRQIKRDENAAKCSTTSEISIKPSDQGNSQSMQCPEARAVPTARRDMPCCGDTDQVLNQLAVLAATVGRSPASSAASTNSPQSSSSSSTTSTAITQPDGRDDKDDLETEESFHYLRNLITVSCLSHHPPGNISTPFASGDQDRQPLRRKRASSRLSLRVGDLPSLPFTNKASRKPCPRYTTIPPIHTPKPITMRPEVRF